MSKRSMSSTTRSFIICIIQSLVTIIILSMIMAAVLMKFKDPTGKLPILALITMLISAAASGFVSSKLNPTGKLSFSLLSALSVTLIMLLTGLVASAGHLSGSAFMNYLCYLAIYALLSYFTTKGKRHRRRRSLAHKNSPVYKNRGAFCLN